MQNISKDGHAATIQWIRVGIIAGFLVCISYPVLVVLQPFNVIGVVLSAAFGPLLAVGSFGLRSLLSVHRRTWAGEAAPVMNTIGGALFSIMLLIQFAEPMFTGAEKSRPEIVSIWLALDVGWDVYVALGTILFAVAMFRHPRFPWPFPVAGLIICAALLVLNIYTFPRPPASSGLFDIGPAVGLWYLAVTVQMLRSVSWARATLGLSNSAAPD